MTAFNHQKYQRTNAIALPNRQWPNRAIEQAPNWCSVDLRDGNQALIEPMSPAQKHRLYEQLIKVGFKEIEVGFPAASDTDYQFVRDIIEHDKIPADVTVQILTPARQALIKRSFESLKGARRAIVHLYNSTSTVQREQVFQLDKQGIIDIAVQGAQWVKDEADKYPETEWVFQYSPESFTGTEMDFAVEVCNAVNAVWQPTEQAPVIINLPATVEMTTPNVYADQIEWFCQHINNREGLLISLHTHNDRGCAVAAAELGVMAGADRVEGTLFGNGERTGNMDVITMAMNLYSQGIDPQLDLSAMDELIHTYTACTQLPVHPRHPYAGELVFTAFSGSHQDAINKCLKQQADKPSWDVAYLPINPADLGRSYEQVIRIKSQSGKGGIAYVIAQQQGLQLPRSLQIEFSAIVQNEAERSGSEVSAEGIWQLFEQHYLQTPETVQLVDYQIERSDEQQRIRCNIINNGQQQTISGQGGGLIEAFVDAISQYDDQEIIVLDYNEHSLGEQSNAQAACYVQTNINGQRVCGVGMSADIIEASLQAILNSVNRAAQLQQSDYAA